MAVHRIETLEFLVEFAGLPALAIDEIPDRSFGAELRRRLFEAMEAVPAARWVRERRLGVRFAPTEPHGGRYVFRMIFALDEEASR